MPRADSDAVAERPTLEQEIARFKTFATTNGETSGGEPTDEEKERIAADAAQSKTDKAVAATNAKQQTTAETPEETPEEREAREAAETPEEAATRVAAETAAKKTPNKLTAEQRINQAVGRQRIAERNLDAANARHASDMASLSARLQALESGKSDKTPQAQDTSGKPDSSKFEFGELDTRYIEALTDWKVDQKLNSRQAQQYQQTLTAAQQAEQQQFTERKEAVSEAGREKYPDFDEVVLDSAYHPQNNPGGWLLSETVGKLALTSSVGQDVLYHLASDPKEAAKVYRLSPTEQAVYFGRLEATFSPAEGAQSGESRLTNGQQQTQAKTPKAPPPPQNRGKGAGSKTTVSGDTSDFAAFERAAMGQSK